MQHKLNAEAKKLIAYDAIATIEIMDILWLTILFPFSTVFKGQTTENPPKWTLKVFWKPETFHRIPTPRLELHTFYPRIHRFSSMGGFALWTSLIIERRILQRFKEIFFGISLFFLCVWETWAGESNRDSEVEKIHLFSRSMGLERFEPAGGSFQVMVTPWKWCKCIVPNIRCFIRIFLHEISKN